MPKQRMSDQIAELQDARRNDRICMNDQLRTIAELKLKLEATEDIKRQLQWHKTLSQNLSEAICAHMRNR